MIMDDEKVTLFGIWITSKGWLRSGKNNDVFADYSYDKVSEVSRCIGNSQVRFVDESIIDLEARYLENERSKEWHIFKNFFERKNNNSSNKG